MKRSFLREMMENYQSINEDEDGISFAKEGFTQLYETVLEEQKEQSNKTAKRFLYGLVTGTAIGGLTAVVTVAIDKRIKRNKISESEED